MGSSLGQRLRRGVHGEERIILAGTIHDKRDLEAAERIEELEKEIVAWRMAFPGYCEPPTEETE